MEAAASIADTGHVLLMPVQQDCLADSCDRGLSGAVLCIVFLFLFFVSFTCT